MKRKAVPDARGASIQAADRSAVREDEIMKIRKLELEEHGSTRPLYEEIFDEDSPSFVDYYYTEKTKDNQIYVLEADGDIRSMLHLNPYRLMVNGSEKLVHYIVAVATQEAYRHRGYMKAIIKKALKDMYDNGESFTFLMPASEAIYLPHDFRTVYEQKRRFYVPESEQCEEVVEEEAAHIRDSEVSRASEADCPELAEFANENLREHYQVYALRDVPYYERLIKEYESDGGKLLVRRINGCIADCMTYVPDYKEGEEKHKIMVRIVDVRRMLMSLSLESLTAVCFRIVDPVIEENNQCVVLTGTEFSGVMLMEGKPGNSEGTMTVAALASLIFGAESVDKVCEEDGVVMSERMKKEMMKIIPLSKIYLNEVV